MPTSDTTVAANVRVEVLVQYSRSDAEEIGALMPFLNPALSSEPTDEILLRNIIGSRYHEQLVARIHGVIVGVATLNMLMGPGAVRQGYLEDFVVHPEVRGQSVGDAIWQAMLAWCRAYSVNLRFTSHPAREAAHKFYLAHGAEIKETSVFHVEVE